MTSNPRLVPPVESNPFSTRWIRPGAAPYLFLPGGDAPQLVLRLRELGWWAQILGAHGSGKSTLLQTLRPHLEEAGRNVELHVLHAGQTQLPFGAEQARQWQAQTQLVIDGYEQLGWYSRRWLRRQCRLRKAGLLVTAHRPLRLPLLWTTEVTPEIAQAVVARLLPPAHRQIIADEDLQQAYAACSGNLREMLFALYDIFEARSDSRDADRAAGAGSG